MRDNKCQHHYMSMTFGSCETVFTSYIFYILQSFDIPTIFDCTCSVLLFTCLHTYTRYK